MFVRAIFISMTLAIGVAAQSSGRSVAPSPSEIELNNAPLEDIGGNNANSQTLGEVKPPSAWRAFGSLVFVLGIAGGGIWALRKWGIKRLPGTGGNRIKVEETLALGERRFVSILKVDDERFLIASYPQGLGLLARLDGSVEPGFGPALEHQINIQAPIPVRDMEAKLRGEQP